MASPVSSALAQLDGSLQALQSQIDRLQAALEVEDDPLRHSLTEACQKAAMLCDLVRAERPDADWADRPALDQIIHDLERATEEKRNQQRREKVLELADELAEGSLQHRSAARAAALNALRLQAVEELRKEAAGEGVKELPGPNASEWLRWACSLQDGADAPVLEPLRRDFPALERLSGELEERYWRPPTGKTPEPSHASLRQAQKASTVPSEPPSRPQTVWRSELSPDSSASTAVIIPSSDLPPHSPPAKEGQNDAADTSPTDHAAAAHDAHLESTLQVAAAPQSAEQASPQASQEQEAEEEVFPSFGQSASREPHVALWIAVASVVLLCAVFAGIHYFHGRGNRAPATGALVQDSDLNVARAATTSEPAASGTSAPDSNVPMTAANVGAQPVGEKAPAAPTVAAKLALPMLHRQPDEGAQDKILLSMESCQRMSPASIECWGYVSNLGPGGSLVSLDRVDVVDGKGNTFSLDKHGQFAFPNGKSSNIPAGSRVKYALKVPDKDPAARTLTLYLDISNPVGLEYTFRDVPVAE
jgi:hypothetical protein